MLNRHWPSAISRDVYPLCKFKYIFQLLTPTLPIHHGTLIGLRWRIRVHVLIRTSNVKGQIERKFSKSKNFPYFDLLGALEISGYEKLRFLLQKAHSCANPRCLSKLFERFCVKIGCGGLGSRVEPKEKQVTRGSHRNDMSPLTQGLNYRSACDSQNSSNNHFTISSILVLALSAIGASASCSTHSSYVLVHYCLNLVFREYATTWDAVFAMNVTVMSIRRSSVVPHVKTARYEHLLLCFYKSVMEQLCNFINL